MLKVDRARLCTSSLGSRLEGVVDSETLFWEMPSELVRSPRGEPFVAALLTAAMRRGVPIQLGPEVPVDREFLANISQLQRAFVRWFPDLTEVEIRATERPYDGPANESATGYSGGIDSSFTMDQLHPTLDAALLIDGIEYPKPDTELSTTVANSLRGPVESRGLRLLRVRTNVKQVGRALGARWNEQLGGALASCAHAAGFGRYHIAASNSWENLRPYGSHPLTDRLWSSDSLEISHHGAELRRVDKITRLASTPDLLASLRVCFQGGEYNCGRCHKCLQTAAGLRATGVTASSIPTLEDPSLLRSLTIEHEGDFADWVELIHAAQEQKDHDLQRELVKLTRRFRWRRFFGSIDALTTGGLIRSKIRARRTRGA